MTDIKKVYTRGNVVVNDIKIGDIHYEYEFGFEMRVEVISLPVRSEDGAWTWKSKTKYGEIIHYLVAEGFEHYWPKLYNYKAYHNCKEVQAIWIA